MAHGKFLSPFIAHEFNRNGVIFDDGTIRVIAAENSHYALMPAEARRKLKSYAYRIETPHGVIVFTGDTGPSDAVVRLARGADVLVAESNERDQADTDQFVKAMAARNHWSATRAEAVRAHFQSEHLDADEVGQLAAAAEVKAVILYHYEPADRADQEAYVAAVKQRFSGPVFAPDDLDRYCMPGASTGIAACGRGTADPHP
jgi:ribonuclease BN (tRNA processing enzyme)